MFWPTLERHWGWSPLDELRRLQRDINVLFDGTGLVGRADGFPHLNMHSTKDAVIVMVALPGVDPKDVELHVQQDLLTISGTRSTPGGDAKSTLHRQERFSGAFARALQLPCKVDTEHIAATCKSGVLTVTLPRAPEDKPKSIAITVA
jgi:HSP20 family protein